MRKIVQTYQVINDNVIVVVGTWSNGFVNKCNRHQQIVYVSCVILGEISVGFMAGVYCLVVESSVWVE